MNYSCLNNFTFLSAMLVLVQINFVVAQNDLPEHMIPKESSYTMVLKSFADHKEYESGTGSNPAGTVSAFGAIKVGAPKDGTGRVFVSFQTGKIIVYDSLGKELNVFLDLSSISSETGFINGEGASAFRGLMYFDFHPQYGIEGSLGYGKIYLGYQVKSSFDQYGLHANYRIQDFNSRTGSNQYAISEFTVDLSDKNKADINSYREIFRVQTEGNNPHGLGELAFNPNLKLGDENFGLLYVAIGDGNALGNNAPDKGYIQQLNNPFGKILCINPLQTANSKYSIPLSNPYYGQQNTAQEIYAVGFRDPQTFSFSKDLNGEQILIVFDIGASDREEIVFARPGGNYGWDRFEGTLIHDSSILLYNNQKHSLPVVEYDHSISSYAIAGGLIVSDLNDGSFKEKVIFTDLPTGRMFFSDYKKMLHCEKEGTQSNFYEITNFDLDNNSTNQSVSIKELLNIERGDIRFGFDEKGAVYLISKQVGKIFKTDFVRTKNIILSSAAQNNFSDDIILYPNPADEYIKVKMPKSTNNTNLNVSIRNYTGIIFETVVKYEAEEFVIDLDKLESGFYIVDLIINDRSFHEKIFIK